MKPTSNKETPKIIALAALAVAAVGVGVVQFVLPQGAGANANAASPKASPSPEAGASSGNGAASAASATSGADPAAVAAASGPIPMSQIQLQANGRDPFMPSGPAAAEPVSARPLPPASPPPYIPRVPQNGEIGKGLRAGASRDIGDIVLGPRKGASEASSKPVIVLPPPPPPAYTVTGVVLGDRGGRDVAILRGSGGTGAGQEERRFVTVGEDVGNGFYVASIHANGIILRSRTNTSQVPVSLDLGKTE